MGNKIANIFDSIDENTKKVMKKGIEFCLLLTLISIVTLLYYKFFYSSIFIYYIGFYLFKNSLLFGCAFFAFGLAFDKIKKDLY